MHAVAESDCAVSTRLSPGSLRQCAAAGKAKVGRGRVTTAASPVCVSHNHNGHNNYLLNYQNNLRCSISVASNFGVPFGSTRQRGVQNPIARCGLDPGVLRCLVLNLLAL